MRHYYTTHVMWELPHATVTHLERDGAAHRGDQYDASPTPESHHLPSRDLRSKYHSVSVDAHCLKLQTDQTKKNPSSMIRRAELKKNIRQGASSTSNSFPVYSRQSVYAFGIPTTTVHLSILPSLSPVSTQTFLCTLTSAQTYSIPHHRPCA